MNIFDMMKSLFLLAIISMVLMGIAAFILPTSGLSASILAFFPAGFSFGLMVLCIIPFVVFFILLYKAVQILRRLVSAF